MSIVLDSTVLIDILRGEAAAQTFYRELDRVPSCSEVSRAEILRGMHATEKSATNRLLASLDWVAVDAAIAQQAGAFGRAYRRSHRGIELADLLIAATASVLAVPLVTTNQRHFPMLDDVVVPYRV